MKIKIKQITTTKLDDGCLCVLGVNEQGMVYEYCKILNGWVALGMEEANPRKETISVV